MQSTKLIVATASVSALLIAAPALACAKPVKHTDHDKDHKVGICHATGSKTNPYVFIRVDEHAEQAHEKHQDDRDIVGVKSAAQCPKGGQGHVTASPSPTPMPSPSTQPSPTPVATPQGQVLGASTGPAQLPDTGAGLSTMLGVPSLAVAGRAYLRARRGR